MKPTYTINHKAAMDDAFRPPKCAASCHLCRNAKGPAKPGEPFSCGLNLPMDAKRCESFHDARRPSFDYAKVYG